MLESKIIAAVKADDFARRLMTIAGVGHTIAATVRAAVQYAAALRTGRYPVAWIGIKPRVNSSGGNERRQQPSS